MFNSLQIEQKSQHFEDLFNIPKKVLTFSKSLDIRQISETQNPAAKRCEGAKGHEDVPGSCDANQTEGPQKRSQEEM